MEFRCIGDNELLSYATTDNEITFTLARPLTTNDIAGRSYFLTTLLAHRQTVDSGSAVIMVDIPSTTPAPSLPIPKFEKQIYRGVIDTAKLLIIETIILIRDTYDVNVTFILDGGT